MMWGKILGLKAIIEERSLPGNIFNWIIRFSTTWNGPSYLSPVPVNNVARARISKDSVFRNRELTSSHKASYEIASCAHTKL